PHDDRALEDITLHRQLRHLATQPHQLGPLIRAQPAVTGLAPVPVHRYPVGQGAFLDPQVPRHRRDRLARLPHDAHRALAKLRLEPTSRLRHRPPSNAGALPIERRPPHDAPHSRRYLITVVHTCSFTADSAQDPDQDQAICHAENSAPDLVGEWRWWFG